MLESDVHETLILQHPNGVPRLECQYINGHILFKSSGDMFLSEDECLALKGFINKINTRHWKPASVGRKRNHSTV